MLATDVRIVRKLIALSTLMVLLILLLGFNSALGQPLTLSLTLVYTRANGRIGDIALTGSGEVLFTNYPSKPGRLWLLSGGSEKLVCEASKTTYDLYGVAVLKDGDVYVSCSYTGEVLRIARGGNVSTVYVRASKNVGPLAFAPNGTLYFAELIPTEGYQSVFKLVPGFANDSGKMFEIPVYTAPLPIGGIAFNNRANSSSATDLGAGSGSLLTVLLYSMLTGRAGQLCMVLFSISMIISTSVTGVAPATFITLTSGLASSTGFWMLTAPR